MVKRKLPSLSGSLAMRQLNPIHKKEPSRFFSVYYNTKSKKKPQTYIILFLCILSRAVHLELTPNLTTHEFTKCFQRLIAGRGRTKIVYSDNVKTFQAIAKWLKQVIKSLINF